MSGNGWRCKADTFVYYRIHYATKERMAYGGERSEATKRTRSYGRLIVGSPEDTMQEMQRQGKYGATDYGGRPHKRLGSVHEGMRLVSEDGPTDRASTDAAPINVTLGAVPKMGIGLLRTFQTPDNEDRKMVYHRSNRLLYEMG